MINFSTTYNSEKWTDKNEYQNIIQKVCLTTSKNFEINECELAVVLADNEFVQVLNNRYRNQDKPTNVLSFPADNTFNTCKIEQLGDIIIAYETLESEAGEQGKSFQNHFTHLVLHGLLHLLGYDHIDKDEAEEMEQLERKILKDLGIDDPYEGTELIG